MKYYAKLTILLGLIWGFIAIQRIVIAIIMPAIQADMKFSYTDVGMIISITGLVWAFGTIIWASIGDTYGRRPVIVVCTILASIFSWMTGMVHTLGGMLTVRGILGFFEGGPWGPGGCHRRRRSAGREEGNAGWPDPRQLLSDRCLPGTYARGLALDSLWVAACVLCHIHTRCHPCHNMRVFYA